MAIVDEDLEQVRSTLVLSDVVQQYVALRRQGRNWVGLCPFHAEKSGSFNVRDETGRYRCFGCGAAGDVFNFVQQIEHVDFVTAVEDIAARCGMRDAVVRGSLGSLVGAVFVDGASVPDYATEVLVASGSVRAVRLGG